MRKSSLTCFGVGDGWSCADRNHASFLYRFGRTSILIDCGEPIDRSLTAAGIDCNSIDGIFLSHLHSDHVGGLFMLMQGLWLQGRKRDLPIHLPAGAIKPMRAMFNATFLFDDLLPFKRRLVPLKREKAVSLGDVRVTPFPTSHLQGLQRRFKAKHRVDFSAFCFLIETGQQRIGHSADLGKPEDLEPLFAKRLDLLVCELSHLRPEQMFAYLNGRNIGKVVFVHLSDSQWKNIPKLRQLAKRMFPEIPCGFACDGDVIQF
jgi:ribonuclease BN (tRNA processing enzyme)